MDSYYDVAIILGSQSDLNVVCVSGMSKILDKVGVRYHPVVISAHRNPTELEEYVTRAVKNGVKVFIGIAGMSAALPGAIAAFLNKHTNWRPVIGVPLTTTEYPDGKDAQLSMVRMPPGMPVAVCGIGKSGLQNAALFACQIVALSDEAIRLGLADYMLETAKMAVFNISLTEGEANASNP